MCSRQTFLMWLFVLVKLGDFTGDVFLLVWLLQQNQINLFSITSPQLPVTNLSMEYCRPISFFNESKEIVNSVVRDGVFSTWTYLVIAGFCFLMFPAVVPLSIPPQVFGDVFDDNIDDDVVSIDYEFRAEEKGMKRMMRYFPIILLVIIHDITLSGIAMDVFSSIMSPHGTRCQQCFMNIGVGCSNDGKLDWNKAHIFPQQLDYYWLITIGTKIVSAMMSMGYIVYLELQYRYQLRVIQQQRNVLLLRRHFGRKRTKMQNNCFGLCFSAFFVSFIFL
uniref:Uncharacterized protein n=1 Tax=Ciona savignyi TaxID=51511 RepID=H2YYP2_CIOSA